MLKNEDGTDKVVYEPYVKVKQCGAEVGTRLFGEE